MIKLKAKLVNKNEEEIGNYANIRIKNSSREECLYAINSLVDVILQAEEDMTIENVLELIKEENNKRKGEDK